MLQTPGVRVLHNRIFVMQHLKNNETQILEADLQSTDDLRFTNLKALARLVAENRFLRSIITANSHKPIEAIMRDGESLIAETYREISENEFKGIEGMISALGKAKI